MMATTIYLWWTDEKRKSIEAQWCAATIWGEITNFVFYALTSKILKLDGNPQVPEYYYLSLTWGDNNGQNCIIGNTWCDTIVFSFATWNNIITEYETHTPWNTCRWSNSRLRFNRSWTTSNDIKQVKMNKWFTVNENNINDKNVFVLENNWWSSIQFVWDIIISVCLNPDCTDPREITKYAVDWRSQTISTKNCKFYEYNDANKCREREI